MNGGIVPFLMIGFTVGLMLAFAPPRETWVALGVLTAAALLAFALPIGLPETTVFVGLWGSLAIIAATTYFRVARAPVVTIPLSLIAGLCIGTGAGYSDDGGGLVLALLFALASFPGKWIVARKFDIAVKVVASWMIAIASLSMFVSLMPTPGYKPDHME